MNSIFTSSGNFYVTAGACLGAFWISNNGITNVIWASIIGLAIAVLIDILKRKI